jgi:hypothetical protein
MRRINLNNDLNGASKLRGPTKHNIINTLNIWRHTFTLSIKTQNRTIVSIIIKGDTQNNLMLNELYSQYFIFYLTNEYSQWAFVIKQGLQGTNSLVYWAHL